MIVIDASAVLEILAKTQTGLDLASVLGPELHAPQIIDLEVANAVRRWELSGLIGRKDGGAILDVYRAMNIRRYDHAPLLGEIWELRHNLTAYDAAFVALADALEVPLVTCDARLANAPGVTAELFTRR